MKIRSQLGEGGKGFFDGSVTLFAEELGLFVVGLFANALGESLFFNLILGLAAFGDYTIIAEKHERYVFGYLSGILFMLSLGTALIPEIRADMIVAFVVVGILVIFRIYERR